jgi:hypothetical protein
MRPTIRSVAASKALIFTPTIRHYCYLPLYCFCGNISLFAGLRDCRRDGTVEALQKMVPAIRCILYNVMI